MTKEDAIIRIMEILINNTPHVIYKHCTVSGDLWEIIKPTKVDPITGEVPKGLYFRSFGVYLWKDRFCSTGYAIFNSIGACVGNIND